MRPLQSGGIDASHVPSSAPVRRRIVTCCGRRPRDDRRRTRRRRHGRRFLAGEDRQRRGQRNGHDPGVYDWVRVAHPQARQAEAGDRPCRSRSQRGPARRSDRRSSRSRRSGQRAPALPPEPRASRLPRSPGSRPRRLAPGGSPSASGGARPAASSAAPSHVLYVPIGIVLPSSWLTEGTRFQDALKASGYGAQILFSQDSATEAADVRALIGAGHQGPHPYAAGFGGRGSGRR